VDEHFTRYRAVVAESWRNTDGKLAGDWPGSSLVWRGNQPGLL